MRQALALVLMVVWAGLGAPEAKDKGADLVGTYLAEGANPDGKPYTAMVVIEQYDQRYKIEWTFESGGSLGIGIIHDGKLVISIFGGPPAVAACDIKKDKLTCAWAVVVAPGIYREKLTRVPKEHRPTPSAAPKKKQAHEHAA